MIVMTVSNISKSFGGNNILNDISFTLKEGERLALVGVNGCGKSTLLKILSGVLSKDEGNIALYKGMKMGYLEQTNTFLPNQTVYEVLLSVFDDVIKTEQKLRQTEEDMSTEKDADKLEALLNTYARLQDLFEKMGGYSYQSAILGVLKGLGFEKEQHNQVATLLSGGEMTRLALGKLLLQKPDVLLLDEPTNHLDLEMLDWLEKYLLDYKGSLIVVSHDRFFLDRVCTGVMEILLGSLQQYDSTYTRYLTLRLERFTNLERAYDAQQKEIKRQEEIIKKLRSFNREKSIKRAESREKMLDKMEVLDKPQDERQVFFSFSTKRRTGDDVLLVENLKKSFDQNTLFEHVSFMLKRGDRAALIGANGIGKTTLFKCILGKAQVDGGRVQFGSNVDVGYYDQHQSNLHPEKDILFEVWDDFPRLDQTEVRTALSQFLFTGEDVFEKISVLSGGEKGRVALTKLMLRKDNLLFLDEPTNHLDMDSREVLEDALEAYDGTILAISHDRYFINRFANCVLELTENGIVRYEGNYDAYINMKERENSGEDAYFDDTKTKTEQLKEKRKLKDEKEKIKALKIACTEAEKQVQACEEEVEKYEKYMETPASYQDEQAVFTTTKTYKQLKDNLQRAYDAWEQAEESLSAMDL